MSLAVIKTYQQNEFEQPVEEAIADRKHFNYSIYKQTQ